MTYSEMIANLDADKLAYLMKRIDGKRRHKLLDKASAKKLPALRSQDTADPTVFVKLFSIQSAATWYATEFDGDRTFFGYVDLGTGFGLEAGYFDLYELGLLTFTGYGVPSIERDRFFKPCKLSEVRGN